MPPRRWGPQEPSSPVSTTSSWTLPAADLISPPDVPGEDDPPLPPVGYLDSYGRLVRAAEVTPEVTLGRGERLIMRLADLLVWHAYRRNQALILRDMWASWARLRTRLEACKWEPYRAEYGLKGRQKKAAPGPAARARSSTLE